MKKVILLLLLSTFYSITYAQTPKIEKLKKELRNHTKQDTIRVNRLNDLSGNQYLSRKEKRKYAEEALAISQKINYPKGCGYALTLIATVEYLEENIEKGKNLLHPADSIAQKTGDLKLKALVLRRMATFEKDAKEID